MLNKLIVTTRRNRQSTFSPLKPFVPLPSYFKSEWSYAQYRIPSQSAHISLSAGPSKPPTADIVDEEKCVVGWIRAPSDDIDNSQGDPPMEYQLVALTYTGGWYRLSLPKPPAPMVAPLRAATSATGPKPALEIPVSGSPPRPAPMSRPRSSSGSSAVGRLDKGKDVDRDKDSGASHECMLREFRRFGRWDGWG